jgi:hypothetical protein
MHNVPLVHDAPESGWASAVAMISVAVLIGLAVML